MLRFRKLSFVLVLALITALPLAAQDWSGRGRVQGKVTNQDGNPLVGATVILHQAGSPDRGPDALTTNKKGAWSYLGLAGGAWTIMVQMEGFVPSEGTMNVTELGINPTVSMQLRPIPKEQKIAKAMGFISQGNELLQNKQYAEARVQYELALEDLEDVDQSAVLRGIASSYVGEGNNAKALETLQRALALNAEDGETLRSIARLNFEMGNMEQAIDTLKQAHVVDAEDVTTLQVLIDLLVRANREEEAQAYMAKLPADAKLDAETVLNTGIKLYNDNKLDEALEQFDRAVQENPDLPDTYYYRGLVYLNKGENELSAADFRKLLELAPDHAKAGEVKEFLKYVEQQ